MSENTTKRGKRGEGRLYIRTPDKKEHPAGTQGTGGNYWLAYREQTGTTDVTGKPIKKLRRVKLKDENGNPITTLPAAKVAQQKIVRQFIAASEEERLALLISQHQKASSEKKDALPVMKLGEVWAAYEASSERPDSGEDTLRRYQGYWNKFREWLIRRKPGIQYLRDITAADANDYAVHLTQMKVSPNTYNKHTGFLKLLFQTLEESARLPGNPFEKVKRKKLKTEARRELSLHELKTVLETATGQLKTLLYIGTFTGLRLGDCATLKWGEVDLTRGIIRRVPSKTKNHEAKPVTIGIPSALHAILSETPRSQRNGYVVPEFAELYTHVNADGKHIRQSMITEKVQAHFRGLGINTHKPGTGSQIKPDPDKPGEYIEERMNKRAVVEVGFHSLRHTYVSIQAERGTPQAVVQAIVGHGNPAMTAHYTHIGEEAAKQAALAMPSNIVDAQFEELPAPIPDWAVELIKELTPENCSELKQQLLEENEKALMK